MQLYQKRESIIFDVNSDQDSIVATVCRGPSKARFAINRAIMNFVELFSLPCTTDDAIEKYCSIEKIELTQQRLSYLQEFAKQVTATLLLTPIEKDAESAEESIAALGFTHIETYKDKRFDTVSLVSDGTGKFVIKNVKESIISSSARDSITRLFQNEFNALRRLTLVKGVVKPLTLRMNSKAFFAMSFVEGERLDRFVRNHALSLQQRLSLSVELIDLLEQVHQHGVFHGDLHLGNFMCSADQGLTIIDFGCAVIDGEPYRPGNGATPHFLPPERASSDWNHMCKSNASKASECYQLAIIVSYVLTGTLPFRGKTFRELHKAIVDGKHFLPKLTPQNEEIPLQILDLIVSMLDTNPEKRPIDLRQVSQQFNQHLL